MPPAAAEARARLEAGAPETGTVPPEAAQPGVLGQAVEYGSTLLGDIGSTALGMGKAALGVTPALGPERAALALLRGQGVKEALSQAAGIPAAQEAMGGMIAPQIAEAKKVMPLIGQGRDVEAVGHGLAAALPMLGPVAAQAGEELGRGEYGAGLAHATEALVPAVAPEILGRVREGLRGTPEQLATKGTQGLSEALQTPAGKGGIRAAEMDRNIQIAQSDISKLAREQPLTAKGAERFHEMAEKIGEHQDKLWDEGHKPGIERHANAPIDQANLVSAGQAAITAEAADAAPAEAAAAQKWLETGINKARSLESLDKLVREINDDLRGKDVLNRYGPLQIRVRQAVVKAARGEIDRTLESFGEQGVRDINQRWGALDKIKDRLEERAVQEGRTETRKGPIPDWVHLYSFMHPGLEALPVSVGAGFRIGSMLRPDMATRLGRSYRVLGRAGLEPPPMPEAPPEQLPLVGGAGPLFETGGGPAPFTQQPLLEPREFGRRESVVPPVEELRPTPMLKPETEVQKAGRKRKK